MELWTALALGFLGSFHCVGMCGPIAMSIPRKNSSFLWLSSYAIVYNSGRILTYSLFGLFFGFLGTQVTISGFQGTLSIILGIGVMGGVISNHFLKRKNATPLLKKATHYITMYYGILFRKNSSFANFGMGILNGLLPCAFVYSGLAAAVLTNSPSHSMLYMTLFGIGTFPAMFFMYLTPSIVSLDLRQMMRNFVPYFAFFLGIFLALRGLILQDLVVLPEITERVASFCVFPETSMN